MSDFDNLLRDLIDQISREEDTNQEGIQRKAEIAGLKAAAARKLAVQQSNTEFQTIAKTMLAMQGSPGSALKVAISYLSLDNYLDPSNSQPLATITHNIHGLHGNLAINLVSQPHDGRRDALSSRHLPEPRLQIAIGNADAPKDFFPAQFDTGSVPVKAILRNMLAWAEEEGLIDRKAAIGAKPRPMIEKPSAEPKV